MKRLLLLFALLSFLGLSPGLAAQQTPSTPDTRSAPSTPSPAGPDSAMPQSQNDVSNSQASARAFEGTIQKTGDEFVLRENASKIAYQLDDQAAARKFAGKDVRVMATVDPSTNRLHVIDITRSDTR